MVAVCVGGWVGWCVGGCVGGGGIMLGGDRELGTSILTFQLHRGHAALPMKEPAGFSAKIIITGLPRMK